MEKYHHLIKRVLEVIFMLYFFVPATAKENCVGNASISSIRHVTPTQVIITAGFQFTTGLYRCNFGDGTQASSTNHVFVHEYADTGTYYPCIILCSDTACSVVHIGCSITGTLQNYTSGNITTLTPTIQTVNPTASYLWGGDPAYTTSLTAPTASFNSANGTYVVTLFITDVEGCTNTLVSKFNLPDSNPCNLNASFSYAVYETPAIYIFANTSSSIHGYTTSWTFYNSTGVIGTSTEKNPLFQFWGISYSARLIITDSVTECSDTIVTSLTPSACGSQSSQFTYQDLGSGTFQFNNTSHSVNSTNLFLSDWIFSNSIGQLGSSTMNSPQFMFTGNAPYYATLTIIDVAGTTCTETSTQTLLSNMPDSTCTASAQFTYQDLGNGVFEFTNLSSTTNGYNSSWVFSNGNGQIGNSANNTPQFTFTGIAPYSATLTVTDVANNTCTESYSQLLPSCSIIADFTYQDLGYGLVQFTNLSSSTNGYISNWRFCNDSTTVGTSTTTNPQFTYTGNPPYTATLVITDVINNSCTEALVTVLPLSGVCNVQSNFSYQDLGNGIVQFTNTSTSAGSYTSAWIFSNNSRQIGISAQNSPQFTFIGDAPYTATLTVTDLVSNMCTETDIEVLNIGPNPCNLHADLTYSLQGYNSNNPDTITLSNTSTSNNGFGFYQATSYDSAGNIVYQNNNLSPSMPVTFVVPQSPSWNVCIQISDSTKVCMDTICKLVLSNACAISALFAYTFADTTIVLHNSSTNGNGLSSNMWTISAGFPTTSVVTDPIVTFPLNIDTLVVCLRVTDAIGCSDNICKVISRSDTLCGQVFNDINGDGIFNLGEIPCPNSIILVDSIGFLTDANGFFTIHVGAGPHSIQLIAPFGWSQTFPANPLNYSTSTSGSDNICGLDFGMRDDNVITLTDAKMNNNLVIELLPNPFRNFMIVRIEGVLREYQMEIFDVTGKWIRNEISSGNIFAIQRGNLSSGLYMFEIFKEHKLVGKGKIVAQ